MSFDIERPNLAQNPPEACFTVKLDTATDAVGAAAHFANCWGTQCTPKRHGVYQPDFER